MLVQGLMGEFEHEVENTRNLLTAIPNSALDYRPQPFLWSVAELASHISEIYHWYPSTLEVDHFKMDDYSYDKGDISTASSILIKFEKNVSMAREALQNMKDEDMMKTWRMTMNGEDILPPMPKVQVVRGFLMNHLYHHRGEMISHLRVTGNTVPSLYGPTYEMMQQEK